MPYIFSIFLFSNISHSQAHTHTHTTVMIYERITAKNICKLK